MPSWSVHIELGKLCGISNDLMRRICEFIDQLNNPEFHDANRVIIDGYWKKEALLPLIIATYENFGGVGIKALLHHHLLDYAATLAISGKYGYMLRIGRTFRYAENAIKQFLMKVLEGIENDFSPWQRLDDAELAETLIQTDWRAWAPSEDYVEAISFYLDIARAIKQGYPINPQLKQRLDKAKGIFEERINTLRNAINELCNAVTDLKQCIPQILRQLLIECVTKKLKHHHQFGLSKRS